MNILEHINIGCIVLPLSLKIYYILSKTVIIYEKNYII